MTYRISRERAGTFQGAEAVVVSLVAEGASGGVPLERHSEDRVNRLLRVVDVDAKELDPLRDVPKRSQAKDPVPVLLADDSRWGRGPLLGLVWALAWNDRRIDRGI
jgi:hypothetical protein